MVLPWTVLSWNSTPILVNLDKYHGSAMVGIIMKLLYDYTSEKESTKSIEKHR